TGEGVWIATTRPELLCTCQLVAVHPDDERYSHLVDRTLLTPIYEKEVRVVADEKVDPEFGSGVVMICTIGDSDDIEWVYKYHLPLEKGIDEQGRMTEIAGRYKGMPTSEAKAAILDELRARGLLGEQREIEQNVGTCWRCHTPVEFLNTRQWFLKTLAFREAVLEASSKIVWHPRFMEQRLIDWVISLNRDWVISRQRYFATPIPVWECLSCDGYVPAREEDCYIDPTAAQSRASCPKCGGALKGSEEVFDTWMDSSISPLYNAFWMRDAERFRRLYPMTLRPQAHEIIRTWTFYTILRCLQITNEAPWKETMISGFIMAPDGSPMHSSLGNVIDPLPILEEYGADALRYFAATCALGVDQAFQMKEVLHGHRLCTKLWNIARLLGSEIKGCPKIEMEELRIPDRWILSRYSGTVRVATAAMEACDFRTAAQALEHFIWHEFADHYLEMIKHRMGKGDKALHFTAYTVFLGCLRALAPIIPHITEELYHTHCSAYEGEISVALGPWPEPVLDDPDAEELGELVKDVIAAVRSWKAEHHLPLSFPLRSIEATGEGAVYLLGCEEEITGTLKAARLVITQDAVVEERAVAIKPNKAILGPKLRKKMDAVVRALAALEPEDAARALDTGHLILELPTGKRVEISKDEVVIEKGHALSGREVNVVKVRDISLIIEVE
ncbi:MAG: class I tRNA ligase family protein, partial [Candidatus Thermoplasmatota archaeon]